MYSPYEYPTRHWELDDDGQPTQRIIEQRRRAEFITPIPKPRKRKGSADQQQIVFDEGKGLSTREQQYDPTSVINELRQQVLTALAELSAAYPDWRFGQMIANLALIARGPEAESVWDMEDEELLAAIRWQLEQRHVEPKTATLVSTN